MQAACQRIRGNQLTITVCFNLIFNKKLQQMTKNLDKPFPRRYSVKRVIKVWTPEEDTTLLQLSERFAFNWDKVADSLQDRNRNQCMHRYRRLKGIKGNRVNWTKQEDRKVIQLVQTYGKDWSLIAKQMEEKSGKQIRERFINKLDPSINKSEWSEMEDLTIIRMYNQIGSKWKQISLQLQGRPQNMIKNRFNSHLRRAYSSLLDEDEPQPSLSHEKKQLTFDEDVEANQYSAQVSDIYDFYDCS